MKQAFTLTEVLITLGIIGVISALTVPNIMNKWQQEAQATQFRKVSVEMANAADMLISEEGKTSLAGTYVFKDVTGATKFIESKFKISKTCEAKASGCFASSYRALNNMGKNVTYSCDGKSYILANSAAVCILKDGDYLKVQLDINGKEDPNIGGRDMFWFYIDKKAGLLGYVRSAECTACLAETGKGKKDKELCDTICNKGKPDDCGKDSIGTGCFDKLSEDGWKMNY